MDQTTLFQTSDYYSSKWYIFKNTQLGNIHATIPWGREKSVYMVLSFVGAK